MSNLKKGIWFPLSLILLIVVIALWFPYKYGEAFLLNHRLLNEGVKENAQIIAKGILVDDKLLWSYETQLSDNHQFRVKIHNGNNDEDTCQFGVSKSLYDYTPPGGKIPVTFLPDNPQKCGLSAVISRTQPVLSWGIGLSAFMLLFAAGSSFFIHRMHKRPGPGSSCKLTTKIESENSVICPECNAEMTEGYLPMGLGINWRNIDQPVGIPTIFSGLPNTVLWLKRPKLHAYHCEKCKVVIFKYGKREIRN